MRDPASLQRTRIDYLLHAAPDRNCVSAEDTRLFNAEPTVGELAFPSDRTGVALALRCEAAAVDAGAAGVALPDEPEPPKAPEAIPSTRPRPSHHRGPQDLPGGLDLADLQHHRGGRLLDPVERSGRVRRADRRGGADRGRWFVSKATFCDLVALSPGAEEVTVG